MRRIDGAQNIADVLTKIGVDKSYVYKELREARWFFVQDSAAAALKLQMSGQVAARKAAIDAGKVDRRQREKVSRAEEMKWHAREGSLTDQPCGG